MQTNKTVKHSDVVIMLYITDAWHTHISRELVRVFSNQDELNKYLTKMKRTDELSGEDMAMLINNNQTQGRDTNYFSRPSNVNPFPNH